MRNCGSTSLKKGHKKAKKPLHIRGSFACDCLCYGFYSATGVGLKKVRLLHYSEQFITLFFAPTLYLLKPLISSPQPLALPLEGLSQDSLTQIQ